MIELNEFRPVVDTAVSITVLMGTGAAVTWWLTRRIENRIKDEVKHMDRLQSIENRVTSVETKVDGLEVKVVSLEAKVDGMEAKMITKDDLAEMETRMSIQSKNDMATVKTELLEAIKNVNGNAHR